METRSLRSRCQHVSVSDVSSLPALQIVTFSLCPHMGSWGWGGWSQKSKFSVISSCKGTNPIMRVPTLLNLIISQRSHLKIPFLWGLGVHCMNWGRQIQSTAKGWREPSTGCRPDSSPSPDPVHFSSSRARFPQHSSLSGSNPLS